MEEAGVMGGRGEKSKRMGPTWTGEQRSRMVYQKCTTYLRRFCCHRIEGQRDFKDILIWPSTGLIKLINSVVHLYCQIPMWHFTYTTIKKIKVSNLGLFLKELCSPRMHLFD